MRNLQAIYWTTGMVGLAASISLVEIPIPAKASQKPTIESPSNSTQGKIGGWWRGNNDHLYGIYQRRRSRNINGTIYTNNGTPFETFSGTINGNDITVNWRNLCTSSRGTRTGLYNDNTIQWTSGDLRDTELRKVNNAPTVQRGTACAQPQDTSMNGWWTTQGRSTWWLGKQRGNKITLTKFVDGNDGKPVTQFAGRINNDGNSAGRLRQCGQQSGTSYSLQRRTNNLYYFGGNNRTLSRSQTAPPFSANIGETCARENINGWWRDQQSRFWKAEQNNSQVTITRYRASDGKPFSIFTGTRRNRSGTDLYSYGTLKNCFSFRNRPRSFSLINGQLRSDNDSTVLTRYQSRIPFTPQTGCDPATAETAAQRQLITLQKTVRLTDYEITVYHERKTKTFNPKQITVSRPSGLSTTNSKFVARGEGCRTHGFYVDEVTYDEWDQVRVDSQGVAALYNNVALRERDATPGSGCPLLATVKGRYYTIPDGEGAAPSFLDRISQGTYNNSVRRGPFISVSPGETKTKTLTINKPEGRIEITYRLSNETQRLRPRDN
ncbi:hypothetical protein MITS9508_02307 [Synechococcus sp. MIT S9508]|nr:hypothetical protein MITS9508_02307 [Synechococcus sp. MIT S9508]